MLVTANHLADLTALDRRTVSRRLASLPAQDEARGRVYDSAAALRLLFGTAGKLDPQEQRARLDRARADVVELSLAHRRGVLIPKDEVAAAWAANIAIAKGRLLSLPARVSGEVLRLKTQREVEAVIKAAIIEILEELAGGEGRGDEAR